MQRIEPTGIIHVAGKKSPTDSVADLLFYARENVGGVISLLEAVRRTGTIRVVFSSSCSVYGTPATDQVAEDAPKTPESPCGLMDMVCSAWLADGDREALPAG